VNQAIVFLVLGGLAAAIVVIRKLLAWSETRVPMPSPRPVGPPAPRRAASGGSQPGTGARVAAIVAAVHAFAGAAPGTLSVVEIARIGADSPWKTVGRMEAMGMGVGSGDGLQ
jgi:hypothetical protein